MLTQERLKELLSYDPATGMWTWLSDQGRAQIGAQAGTTDRKGYILIKVDRVLHRAHRLAFLYMTGQLPQDQVDHVDRNKKNNAWSNLREATNSQNMANGIAHTNNRSGARGVCVHRGSKSKPFMAQIRVDKKKKYLGCFATVEEASAAYAVAAIKFFGEFAPECARSNLSTT